MCESKISENATPMVFNLFESKIDKNTIKPHVVIMFESKINENTIKPMVF